MRELGNHENLQIYREGGQGYQGLSAGHKWYNYQRYKSAINAEIVFSPFNLGKQVCVMAMGRQRRESGDGSATVMILHSGDSGIFGI